MLNDANAFASYSVDDVERAKQFYALTLGLDVKDGEMGTLELHLAGGTTVMLYPKPDHQAASFTVLNFAVDDVERAVDGLTERGVRFEHYEGALQTDARGISQGEGPRIAWFTDPAGNILSVLEP